MATKEDVIAMKEHSSTTSEAPDTRHLSVRMKIAQTSQETLATERMNMEKTREEANWAIENAAQHIRKKEARAAKEIAQTRENARLAFMQMQQEMATKVDNLRALENQNQQLRHAIDGSREPDYGELSLALKRDQEAKAHLAKQLEQEERLTKALAMKQSELSHEKQCMEQHMKQTERKTRNCQHN